MASYTFAVRGRGVFPFDMLRYDRCWPNSSEDATAMAVPRAAFLVCDKSCSAVSRMVPRPSVGDHSTGYAGDQHTLIQLRNQEFDWYYGTQTPSKFSW